MGNLLDGKGLRFLARKINIRLAPQNFIINPKKIEAEPQTAKSRVGSLLCGITLHTAVADPFTHIINITKQTDIYQQEEDPLQLTNCISMLQYQKEVLVFLDLCRHTLWTWLWEVRMTQSRLYYPHLHNNRFKVNINNNTWARGDM